MSIKTDAQVIRDETVKGANTALRVGTNLVAIADDLIAKQAELDALAIDQTEQDAAIALNTNKRSYPLADENKLAGIEAGATADQDLSGLALKTNVLEKDNVTVYTPTNDYHPATKKYVDDSIIGVGGYTDEQAQDAIGTILVGSSEIDLTYNDATPSITASIVAGSIDETKLDLSVNASLDLADSATQPADIANFETTTELNARDTDNRSRANHTGTQLAATISNFHPEVSNNVNVLDNTAKQTNATHTGEVTGATALTIQPTAISGKSANAGLTGIEELLINNAGTLEKTTTQAIADLGVVAPVYIGTAVPTQVIPLNNYLGTTYGTPEWNATYTLGTLVVGGITKVAIDTTGQTVFPTITGATLRTGAAFVAAETFDMVVVTDDGTNTYYYFLSR